MRSLASASPRSTRFARATSSAAVSSGYRPARCMKSESASDGVGAAPWVAGCPGAAAPGARGGRRGVLRGRRGDDLDLPGLELGADLGEFLLVEVVLERERLQGGLLDRRVLLGLLEERGDCKFKHVAQFLHTSFTFVGVRRTRAFATNTYNGHRGRSIPALDHINSPSR